MLTGGRRPLAAEKMAELRRQRGPRHHVVRQVIGWIVLLVGIAGIVLPLTPALILIPAGVALIGRNHWTIRRSRVGFRLILRHAEEWPGWAGSAGRVLRRWEKRFGNRLRGRRVRRWERHQSNPQPGIIG
jgi:hypothetical protein